MDSSEQPFFDLFTPVVYAENQALDLFSPEVIIQNTKQQIDDVELALETDCIKDKPSTNLSPKDQRRAIVGWLAAQKPNSIGLSVPTRVSRYKADVAAFWSEVKGKLLSPSKTMIVEVRSSREACWPDCSKAAGISAMLAEYKTQRTALQTQIRDTESNLRDMDTLFEEFQIWNYSQSTNPEYKECCKKIEEVEEALYKGTRFQQITDAEVANLLYLAVPKGEITVHEIADHWGLLYINEDMSIEVVQHAKSRNCNQDNQLHLVQNIARATYNSMLFAQGIQQSAEEEAVYTPIPRRRRAKKKIENN